MEKKKWSRDWSQFNWDEITAKITSISSMESKEENFDLGINREEFLEYLDWLMETAPEKYAQYLQYSILRNIGMDDTLSYELVKNPKMLKKLLKKARKFARKK